MRDARLLGLRARREQSQPSINASLELFEGLSRPELVRLGRFFTQIDVPAGYDLGRRGTQCQHFGVVLSGQVAISFHDSPAGILPPGCFYGALPLLSPDGDRRRRGSASALEDTRLAIANPAEFSSLLHEFPLIKQRISAITARRRQFHDFDDGRVVDLTEVGTETHAKVEYQIHVPVNG